MGVRELTAAVLDAEAFSGGVAAETEAFNMELFAVDLDRRVLVVVEVGCAGCAVLGVTSAQAACVAVVSNETAST